MAARLSAFFIVTVLGFSATGTEGSSKVPNGEVGQKKDCIPVTIRSAPPNYNPYSETKPSSNESCLPVFPSAVSEIAQLDPSSVRVTLKRSVKSQHLVFPKGSIIEFIGDKFSSVKLGSPLAYRGLKISQGHTSMLYSRGEIKTAVLDEPTMTKDLVEIPKGALVVLDQSGKVLHAFKVSDPVPTHLYGPRRSRLDVSDLKKSFLRIEREYSAGEGRPPEGQHHVDIGGSYGYTGGLVVTTIGPKGIGWAIHHGVGYRCFELIVSETCYEVSRYLPVGGNTEGALFATEGVFGRTSIKPYKPSGAYRYSSEKGAKLYHLYGTYGTSFASLIKRTPLSSLNADAVAKIREGGEVHTLKYAYGALLIKDVYLENGLAVLDSFQADGFQAYFVSQSNGEKCGIHQGLLIGKGEEWYFINSTNSYPCMC